ncbi:type II RES/Xre toxin-antitoxin system antitoxin [Flavitalea sp.]|nr:antitoxin Xre/MbcA/ParS toxin-binding domain-containing protein [Flavitalea sp.]
MAKNRTAESKKGGIKKSYLKKQKIVQSGSVGTNLVKSQKVSKTVVEVNEPEVHYLRDLSQVLQTSKGRPEYKMSSFEKIELVEGGISKKALENLKQKAGLDYDQLSEVLNVARTTLLNKKGNEKFNKDVSDKILGLANVYSYGYEVFEERERFNEWIFRKNKALGGQVPFDILHTSFGREEVKHLIGRIDHGVYS